MTPEQISQANARLRNQSPLEIVRWAIAQAQGRALVSTNFRPFEAVILHLCVQVQPDIPELWVDHGDTPLQRRGMSEKNPWFTFLYLAATADERLATLMGDNVEARRSWIQHNAKDARFLDV